MVPSVSFPPEASRSFPMVASPAFRSASSLALVSRLKAAASAP